MLQSPAQRDLTLVAFKAVDLHQRGPCRHSYAAKRTAEKPAESAIPEIGNWWVFSAEAHPQNFTVRADSDTPRSRVAPIATKRRRKECLRPDGLVVHLVANRFLGHVQWMRSPAGSGDLIVGRSQSVGGGGRRTECQDRCSAAVSRAGSDINANSAKPEAGPEGRVVPVPYRSRRRDKANQSLQKPRFMQALLGRPESDRH